MIHSEREIYNRIKLGIKWMPHWDRDFTQLPEDVKHNATHAWFEDNIEHLVEVFPLSWGEGCSDILDALYDRPVQAVDMILEAMHNQPAYDCFLSEGFEEGDEMTWRGLYFSADEKMLPFWRNILLRYATPYLTELCEEGWREEKENDGYDG